MDHLSIIGAVLGILLGFALYGLAAFIARSKSPSDELDTSDPDAGGTLHDEQTCTPNCVCDQRHEERTAEARTVVRGCPACQRLNRVPVERLGDRPKCGGCGFYLDAAPDSDSVKMFRECMSTLRVLVRESARGEQKPSTKVKA